MRETDLLIIGQGLAGSAIAIRALLRKYRIMVLDVPSENRSSAVAAGLFNPVTGRNMVKTWLADQLFPALRTYYETVERMTGDRFLHSTPIYRPFVSIEEQNEWMGKTADNSYRDFVSGTNISPAFGNSVNDEFGGVTLKQSGYLDTNAYLASVRQYLRRVNMYQESHFESNHLEIEKDLIRYRNLTAKKIIFCQGVGNEGNPWFRFLPIRPLKGEFLHIQSDWAKDVILNRGVYMVPGQRSAEWRVGATFNWNDHSVETTAWAAKALRSKLEELIRIPYTVIGQQLGFRPVTPDRKPIIGAHPEHPSLIIFNGLGTKGVSLAPYFSEVLFRWLENEGTINKEADVSRFN